MKGIIALCTATALLTLTLFTQAAADKYAYGVYCANGKVEVDMRPLDQMKSARGGNVCLLKGFAYKTDADKYAASIGGVGGSCSCR